MDPFRKTLKGLLETCLLTEQINHLGRDMDPEFDVAAISGFGERIVIPRQVAAQCVLDFFRTDEQLLAFTGYMLSRRGLGASGGVIRLQGEQRLLDLLSEKGWLFEENEGRFRKDQSVERTADWGVMQPGQEYYHSFASIDIVGSSELIRTNVKDDVEITMARLRTFIYGHVEKMNGRVWSWYGDGGMAVFFGEDSVARCVLSTMRLLVYLPVFNIAQNELRPETDIRLRVGSHHGTAVYQRDISKVVSPDLRFAMDMEKNRAEPNSLAISDTIFQNLRQEIRSAFQVAEDLGGMKTYLYRPR